MKIPQQTIDKATAIYPLNWRCLLSADLKYPKISGIFKVEPLLYTSVPLEHVTDISVQACINQLAYAGIAEAIRTEQIPELNGLNFEELKKENMLVIYCSKRFRRTMKTNTEISGEIKVDEWRDWGNLIVGYGKHQFENRSCFGKLECALVKPS